MQLIDGILYAFQEQTLDDKVMLNGFGVFINALGMRAKPYLPQICGTIKWRLNHKSPKTRQQSADLISRTAACMMKVSFCALGAVGQCAQSLVRVCLCSVAKSR